jgi:hypothetical protein
MPHPLPRLDSVDGAEAMFLKQTFRSSMVLRTKVKQEGDIIYTMPTLGPTATHRQQEEPLLIGKNHLFLKFTTAC